MAQNVVYNIDKDPTSAETGGLDSPLKPGKKTKKSTTSGDSDTDFQDHSAHEGSSEAEAEAEADPGDLRDFAKEQRSTAPSMYKNGAGASPSSSRPLIVDMASPSTPGRHPFRSPAVNSTSRPSAGLKKRANDAQRLRQTFPTQPVSNEPTVKPFERAQIGRAHV